MMAFVAVLGGLVGVLALWIGTPLIARIAIGFAPQDYFLLAIFGIQQACQITFVSIGKAVCSIIVAVMRKFVLLIPLIYLLPHLVPDPTLGVYLAEPVADTLAVTFTSILFSHQFRKALRTLESERSA